MQLKVNIKILTPFLNVHKFVKRQINASISTSYWHLQVLLLLPAANYTWVPTATAHL